jgi:2-iminobutanoate/2-iminopropanoate deaminase
MSTLLAAINTGSAPKPFRHYVRAMDTGGLVFVSGQLPARPGGTSLAEMPFSVNNKQVFNR